MNLYRVTLELRENFNDDTFMHTQVTMLIPSPNVKFSTFALQMQRVDWPNTRSFVPMEQSLIKNTSFVIGGSMSIVMKPQLLLNQEMLRSQENERQPTLD